MSYCEQITLNGREVLALVIQRNGGFRLRIEQNEWDRTGLCRGERVSIRRSTWRRDESATLSEVTEAWPWAWVIIGERMRGAG